MPEQPPTWDSTITEELLERHLGDDLRAMFRLQRRLASALRGVVERDSLAASLRCDPDDLVQDVWVRVLERRSLESFENRGRGSLRAFLALILQRQILDAARSATADKHGGRHRHLTLDGSLDVAETAPTAIGPEGVVELDDVLDACASALEGDPEQLELWKLRIEAGWTFPEIGRRLDIDPSTARTRFHGIRERLDRMGALAFE